MDRQEADEERSEDAPQGESRGDDQPSVLETAEAEIDRLRPGRSVTIPLVGEFPVRILIALVIFLAAFMAVWMLLWALLGGIGLGLGWILAAAAAAWAFHAYASRDARAEV
jgi:hypothetical protein